jgi:hypothetical protein
MAGDPIEGRTQGRRWHRGAGARLCPKRSSERGQPRRRRRPLRQGFQLLLLPLPTLLLLLLLLLLVGPLGLLGLRKVQLRRVCGILLACGLLLLLRLLRLRLLLLLMMIMMMKMMMMMIAALVLVVVVVVVLWLLLVLLRCPGVLNGMALRRTQPPRRAATARARELGTARCRPAGAQHGPRRRAGGLHGLLHVLPEHALSGANARSRRRPSSSVSPGDRLQLFVLLPPLACWSRPLPRPRAWGAWCRR